MLLSTTTSNKTKRTKAVTPQRKSFSWDFVDIIGLYYDIYINITILISISSVNMSERNDIVRSNTSSIPHFLLNWEIR